MRNLPLGAKQGIGFGLILLLMAGMTGFAIQRMQDLRNELDEVNNYWLQRVIAISSLNLNAAALRNMQLHQVLISNEAIQDTLTMQILDLVTATMDDHDRYFQLKTDTSQTRFYSEEEEEAYAVFNASWEEYQELTITAFSLQQQDATGQALGLLTGEAARTFGRVASSVQRLVEINQEGAADAVARAEATFASSRTITHILFAVTIVLSIIIAYVLVHLVIDPVRQLKIAAERVAKGNLNVRLDMTNRDEIGSLARSFNRMTDSLRDARKHTEQQQARIEQKNHELEHALEKLQATQQQLVLKEKMASLGQLTAGIAHEIKNPLNFINNFALLSAETAEELIEELKAHPEAPIREVLPAVEELVDDLKKSTEKIAAHGQRADRIVRSMLQHSRGSSSDFQATDLNAFLEEYINLAYHGMRATQQGFHADIVRDFDATVGEVQLVPQEMGRVLINLFQNAFYALHERARADGHAFKPEMTVRTRRQGGQVVIAVTDNGGGIPAPLRDKIFEPFFTTKPAGHGTGLGLSLSYDIVVQGHKGTLAVDGSDGGTTTFVVTLPG